MTHEEILTWGKDHHYPFLVLSNGDTLAYGETSWHTLLRCQDEHRIACVIRRIEQWKQIEQQTVKSEV